MLIGVLIAVAVLAAAAVATLCVVLLFSSQDEVPDPRVGRCWQATQPLAVRREAAASYRPEVMKHIAHPGHIYELSRHAGPPAADEPTLQPGDVLRLQAARRFFSFHVGASRYLVFEGRSTQFPFDAPILFVEGDDCTEAEPSWLSECLKDLTGLEPVECAGSGS